MLFYIKNYFIKIYYIELKLNISFFYFRSFKKLIVS